MNKEWGANYFLKVQTIRSLALHEVFDKIRLLGIVHTGHLSQNLESFSQSAWYRAHFQKFSSPLENQNHFWVRGCYYTGHHGKIHEASKRILVYSNKTCRKNFATALHVH